MYCICDLLQSLSTNRPYRLLDFKFDGLSKFLYSTKLLEYIFNAP